MEAERCPKCAGMAVLPGCSLSIDVGDGICLVPPGALPPGWNPGIPAPFAMSCCLSCGHAWTQIKPETIVHYIQTHGSELGKQNLETVVKGPYRDLPDFPEARAAADKVAEVDALVATGHDVEARRRYRELTGTTWDHAIASINGWSALDRPKKLAVFGWCPKDKGPADKPEGPGHPMRDRWLDA
jgi:hypothetical protein